MRRAGLALLAAGALVGGAAFVVAGRPAFLPWPILGLWLAGIVCLPAGAALLDRAAGMRLRGYPRREVVAVAALTAVALAARAIAVDRIPANFSGDEGEMGLVAREVLAGALEDPFAIGWLSHPTLWFFLQAGSLRVFGDDVLGLRLLSALIGAATVAALYVFARRAFGGTVAVVASALLAVYHVHLHYSRVGLNNVVDPLPVLVGFAALLHGLRTRSWLAFATAGVAVGVAQHFYTGGRLAPLVVLAVLVHLLVVEPRRLWALRGRLVLMAGGFVLGFGPLLRFFAGHWQDFNARLTIVGLFQSGAFDDRRAAGESAAEILLDQAWRGLGAYTSVDDRTFFYAPGLPLLEPVSAALFVLGIALLAARWRSSESALVLAWLVGGAVLGGMLLVDPPHSTRYVGVAPAICVVVAVALERVSSEVGRVLPARPRATRALLGGAVAGLALWNLGFYFLDYTPRAWFGGPRTETATAIGNYLASRPESTFAVLLSAPDADARNGTLRFLAPHVNRVDVEAPPRSAADVPVMRGRRVYLVTPPRVAELAHVRAADPGGTIRTLRSDADGRPLVFAYEPDASRDDGQRRAATSTSSPGTRASFRCPGRSAGSSSSRRSTRPACATAVAIRPTPALAPK